MTLVYDRRSELGSQPCLHALVVGVSRYVHLPGGGSAKADLTFGLRQLSSTALSAFRISQWLELRKDRLAKPLATIRLLLAPSKTEIQAEPALANHAGGCGLAAFRQSAADWRADAAKRRDDVTVFYFAGHGTQRNKGDLVGLLADFGDGEGNALDKAFTTRQLYNGMAPSKKWPEIARTQLYFLDCCSVPDEEIRSYERMETASLWPVELTGRDDRRAPIFYAAIPGSKAYALRGKATFMNRALIECLDGGAGELLEIGEDERWCVTYRGLGAGLQTYVDELNRKRHKDQELRNDGFGEDAVIHYLDEPPPVDLVLEVDPEEAASYARFEVLDDAGRPLDGVPARLEPHPYTFRIPAGYYTINARIVPPHPPYIDRCGRARPLRPGRRRCIRRVIA